MGRMTGDDGAGGDAMTLSASDFRRLATFINASSGIKMPPSKRAMVEGRLRQRLRSRGFEDFDAYCRYLFAEGGIEEEAVHIIDAVTTNKTEFFRETEHFNYLRQVALPALVGRRHCDGAVTVKAWSAACSCGAEPYTLAMVLAEFSRDMHELAYSIFATDLCTEVLRQGASGIYPEDMVAPVPLELRRRYLLRDRDRTARRVRFAPELRQHVCFARLNLMDESYRIDRGFDIIFCRNVLIYFDKPTQAAVVGRLCDHLAPGGYLFLGHSETVAGMTLPVKPVGPTVFAKV